MLIVENGTMPQGANSYISLADADAYLLPRGLWETTPITEGIPAHDGDKVMEEVNVNDRSRLSHDGSEIETMFFVSDSTSYTEVRGGDISTVQKKEGSLIRATDWLNGLDWKGEKVDPMRVMAFPRSGILISESTLLPDNTVPLSVQYACCELAAMVYNGVDIFEVRERGILSKTEKVASLSESVTYDKNAPHQSDYGNVTRLINYLLNSIPGESLGTNIVKIGKG